MKFIEIKNAHSNNLKNIDIDIPRGKLVVITGPSGSGKSSLAFDTIFKEGQRRFLESLSSYGRSYLQSLERPKVDSIIGLSPAIAIDQKSTIYNPRSTVGTVTEIYNYVRMLYAKLATAHSPESGQPIKPQSSSEIIKEILKFKNESKLTFLAPILEHKKGEHRDLLTRFETLGFTKIRVNKEIQYIDEPLKINTKKYNDIDLVIDRVILKPSSKKRIEIAVEKCLEVSRGSLIVVQDNNDHYYSQNYYCSVANKSYPKLDESLFSFNSPKGSCPKCEGVGFIESISESSLFFDKSLSLLDGPLKDFLMKEKVFLSLIAKFFKSEKENIEKPVSKYSKKFYEKLVHGDKAFAGLLNFLNNYIQHKSDSFLDNNLIHLIQENSCDSCHSMRLNPYALNALILDKNISEVCSMEVPDFYEFMKKVKKKFPKNPVAIKLLKEILERTSFLIEIGLDYLTINRKASTLSGGEYQRIRLSTQLGSAMSGVVYILDEPSIGLHQRDNTKLISILKKLKDNNNSVIVVEHDEDTMRMADHIIDVGPEAGKNGGKIVVAGKLKDISKNKNSITGMFLSRKEKIEIPHKRRKPKKFIELKGVVENNLNKLNIKIPTDVFTCITGVSGSGKSTLIHQVLIPALKHKLFRRFPNRGNFTSIAGFENIDDFLKIDQSPIGRTPKSIPATYCQIFGHIRNIFAGTNEAKILGLTASNFSFNVKVGQCEECDGSGYIKFEMPFLSNVYNECPKCEGKRFNEKTLQVFYRDLNIDQVLNLNVSEALEFFKNHKKIHKTLQTLENVGLGYLKLGQPSQTLSGGEAQRIKLSRELAKIKKGKCLYILDEPTTGLHFRDIKLLLQSLDFLVKEGHGVIVIEHNLDIVKSADFILDLGPEGGKRGGQLIAQGNPEKLSKVTKSVTGKYLKKML